MPVIINVIGFPLCQPLEVIISVTMEDKSGVLSLVPAELLDQDDGSQTTLVSVVKRPEILLGVFENVGEFALFSPLIVIETLDELEASAEIECRHLLLLH